MDTNKHKGEKSLADFNSLGVLATWWLFIFFLTTKAQRHKVFREIAQLNSCLFVLIRGSKENAS